MKTATLPAVRVEPALRSDAEAVLDEGESLSDFVASCVRDGVAWRRTQDAFLTRARDAVERSEREGTGIPPQEVLRRMDDRLEAARKQLAAGKPSAGK
ncbi:MAG TPA: YlcI/YnfO family protein [Ideonella sp.]|uniref:YlcI/YnfO family protein n=1 Tax=Ideonella sp. TaxID=1929293 RepID=UPI002CB1F615|nr:YlcI/YnfO family protein [Ideonella sp.]HSI48614.1 YlcI/YnfO family protein [Ideonella sp.]